MAGAARISRNARRPTPGLRNAPSDIVACTPSVLPLAKTRPCAHQRERQLLIGVLLLLAVASPLWGGPQEAEGELVARVARFTLFDACRPMSLVVEQLDSDAEQIALTETSLRNAAESRLRSAGLYSDDSTLSEDSVLRSLLYLNVNILDRAFGISLEFSKVVVDLFGRSGRATTWSSGATGMHGRNATFVVNGVSQQLDKFLTAYLRVNEEACDER